MKYWRGTRILRALPLLLLPACLAYAAAGTMARGKPLQDGVRVRLQDGMTWEMLATLSADGPIKTFPLRGIMDSPPYLHDDCLLTLDDTVEFFNLVLSSQLNPAETRDLVAFMRAL